MLSFSDDEGTAVEEPASFYSKFIFKLSRRPLSIEVSKVFSFSVVGN